MNKEDILKTSRAENQNKDIYELEIVKRGQRIGGLTAIVVAFLLLLVEQAYYERTNYGYFLMITTCAAGMMIYKAFKLRRKHEIAVAMLWIAVTIYAAVRYIISL